ncbi:MAG: hypothetical protein M1820_000943 [Bogoriella megaspora]|nr:MAG: hypothetical protein M1820_000943 [Bogoriella megaspora]
MDEPVSLASSVITLGQGFLLPRDADIERLHRENINYLQAVLVKDYRVSRRATGQSLSHLETVERDLQRYSTALDNYKAFLRMSSSAFENRSSINNLATGIEALPRIMDSTVRNQTEVELMSLWRERLYHTDVRKPLWKRLSASLRLRSLIARFVMAVFGGLWLVVPMVIMAINPNITKSLITTAVSVFCFAVSTAVFATTADPKDVLSSTAAYAAVLVVFVGVGGGQ